MAWWSVLLLLRSLLGCPSEGSVSTAARVPGQPQVQVQVEAPERWVGYGREVTLTAHLSPSTDGPWTFLWEQRGGSPLELGDATRPTLTFRTHEIDALAPPTDGPAGVLALTPAQAGRYALRLRATNGSLSEETDVEVWAGPPHAGWPRANMNVETILDAGLEQDRYDWVFIMHPPLTEPVLQGADSRRPIIRLNAPGRYILREQVSGREVSVHTGPWLGTKECGRVECHPLELQGWSKGKMATVLARGLDGELRHDYSPRCLRCHTVGWDTTAANDGFDDLAEQLEWTFPRRLQPGNFAGLPAKLADRGNVGCEVCHGAGRFYTSYEATVCAGCHEAPPDYVNPVEWRLAPMSKIRDGVTEQKSCRRCHTAQGFLDEYYGHRPVEQTASANDAQYDPAAITCGVCHDVHQGQAPRLVRVQGPLVGQEPVVEWDTGMVCIVCHYGGTQWDFNYGALMRPFVPRVVPLDRPFENTLWNKRLAPHAPQAELVRGRAGNALPGPGEIDMTPPHLTVPGGCVGCHVRQRPPEGDPRRGQVGGHTFAMFRGEGSERQENTLACEPCHGRLTSLSRPVRHDYDGNGRVEGIYEEVNGLLERTRRALAFAISQANLTDGRRRAANADVVGGRIVLVDEQGVPLGNLPEPMTFPADQDRLYRAAYNYFLIVKDRSQGVHNPPWTVRLLQRTILRLNPDDVPQWYWR